MENKNLIIAVILAGLVVVFFGVVLPLITGEREKEKEPGPAPVHETADRDDEAGEEEDEAGEEEEEGVEEAGWVETAGPDEVEDLLGEVPDEVAGVDEGPVSLATELIRVGLARRGASVLSVQLLGPRYVRDVGEDRTKPVDIVSRSAAGKTLPLLTFEAKAKTGAIPPDLVYEVTGQTAREVVFTSRGRYWQVKRTFKLLDSPYQIESSTELKNISGRKRTVRPMLSIRKFLKEAKGGGIMSMFKPQLNIVKGMCMLDGDMERRDIKKIQKKGGIDRLGRVDYLAIDDLYFTAAILPLWDRLGGGGPEGPREVRCVVGPDGSGGLSGSIDFGKAEVGPGETLVLPAQAYLGPKEYETLEAAGSGLGQSVDYGWFGGLARFLYVVLSTFHGWVGNWALAIIMLTILVKLVLSPLTHWSFKSMQKMQAIKPLIDDLNARYPEPEDRDKKNQALMALYRTHKINPMMGCLPMLLQMPIWIALYRMLANSVELYRTPLILWIDDMSQPDPYFVLPLILGASMFLQQKLTPTTADSQQAKIMMYMMPIMFTFFMLMLPAGLNLYILVNTVLTIAQQKLLYRPKVVTAEASQVQLMSDMDQKEIDRRRARKDKDTKTPGRKRGGKGRKK